MSSKAKNTRNIVHPPSQVEWKLKTFLLFSGLFSLGLIFLAISLIPDVAKNTLIASFFSQISGALIISGLYTGISEMLLKQDFLKASRENMENLLKIFSLAEVSKNIGLVYIAPTDSFFDQAEWILNAKTLKVLLRDGVSWATRYSIQLEKRFKNPDAVTVVLLLDPYSTFLDINSKKLNKKTDKLQQKIYATVSRLWKTAQSSKSSTKLSILGYQHYNTYHLVLADDFVMINFYPSSQLVFKSPTFVFQDLGDDCYYQLLKRDIEALEKEAVDLIEQQKSKGSSPN